jgi:type II secretory pathway pseudopilin PulG
MEQHNRIDWAGGWSGIMTETGRNLASEGGKTDRRVTARAGFSLLETLIATQLLLIGMVGLLSLSALSLTSVNLSDNEALARQKARQVLESIFAARNTQQISFSQIRNSSNGGVFLDGFQPLQTAGDDGLIGTLDDEEIEVALLPGKDGLLGNDDDEHLILDGFERDILITQLADNLRQVTVTIRYSTPQGLTRNYLLEGLVSAFR